MTTSVCLSTAYLAPVQYYCKLWSYPKVILETAEHYVKQTYRNRCLIATANGVTVLTVPIEKPDSEKCPTKDIRISSHGRWQHLHWNTFVSAYGLSPFFDYYRDELEPFYTRRFEFLLDFNEALRHLICNWLDIQPKITRTSRYLTSVAADDFRCAIRPKHAENDPAFTPQPYYQVFGHKHGFLPNLSIIDLLFNMGPESVLVLQRSVCDTPELKK